MACPAIAPATFRSLERSRRLWLLQLVLVDSNQHYSSPSLMATGAKPGRPPSYITYSRSGNSSAEPSGGACAASTFPQRWIAATKPAATRPSRMGCLGGSTVGPGLGLGQARPYSSTIRKPQNLTCGGFSEPSLAVNSAMGLLPRKNVLAHSS